MNATELSRQLSEPFPSADVEWRITKVHQRSGLAVPYITSRAIQNRLDNVVGSFCWRTRYIPWHQYVPKPSRGENPEQADRTPIPLSSAACPSMMRTSTNGLRRSTAPKIRTLKASKAVFRTASSVQRSFGALDDTCICLMQSGQLSTSAGASPIPRN